MSHTSELADFPPGRSFVDAARDAIRRAGGVAISMQDFGARDALSAEVCRTEVLGCDVYLGVIGFRYGSRVPGRADGFSFTELEYDVAEKAGMSRLLFLLDESSITVPLALVDIDRSQVERFRQRLRRLPVAFVRNPDDLAARVGESMARLPPEKESVASRTRKPWMAPPLDRMVERPQLGERLLAALTAPGAGEVGLTTGLAGAGGFGKTTLATWACHRQEIRDRYEGGLLWVTVGQEIHDADLAVRANDLAFALSGERPAISDPDMAGAELGRLLDEHGEPTLLVVDDVWDDGQLRPFRFGGRNCTRLITTRVPGLLPAAGALIQVDVMSDSQAIDLVAGGVGGLSSETSRELAIAGGRWPVLLNLLNGVLRRRTERGQPAERAAQEIMYQLATHGPASLDPARPADRTRAVAATVEASLSLLSGIDRERYFDLAIFPEDVAIPVDVLDLIWARQRVEATCETLLGLGLIADFRLDAPGPRVILHDVLRTYLRSRLDADQGMRVHRRLVEAAEGLLPPHDEADHTPWWLLPDNADYLWRFLAFHIREGLGAEELSNMVCDLRWVENKTRRLGSVVGVIADLALVGTRTAAALTQVLQRAVRILGPIEPQAALGATLASRLHGVGELEEVLARYLATLPSPRLEPAWPLPDRADLSSVEGHTGGVTACDFSPDGLLFATTSDDGTAMLWRRPDDKLVAVLTGHTGGVWDCSFSPDGNLLATASDDGSLRLWEVGREGVSSVVISGHGDWVQSCSFSPDGTVIATTSNDGTARLWLLDGTCLAVLEGHTGRVTDCAFSPDGAMLATTSTDHTARLWEVADGRLHRVLTGHTDRVWGCAFSPDGKSLATTSDDRTARLWRVADGTMQRVVTGHADRVWGCAFSPDGKLLATTSHDQSARLWDPSTGELRGTLSGHASWVRRCTFSPDGSILATTSNDQTARLWDIAAHTEKAIIGSLSTRVNRCAFSPDGRWLITSRNDRTAILFQMPHGDVRKVLMGHASRVVGVAFSPDSATVATSGDDRTVRLWDTATSTFMSVLDDYPSGILCCAFSPDGSLLATTTDREVRLWRIPSAELAAVLEGHSARVDSCSISPDGSLLAAGCLDGSLWLWNLPSGTFRAVLRGHTDMVNDCSFSQVGGFLATVSDDKTTRIWNAEDGALVVVMEGHTGWVGKCAFSPDGSLLATASNDGSVRIWRVPSGQVDCALRVGGPLVGIAWHPSGDFICATGGAGTYVFSYRP